MSENKYRFEQFLLIDDIVMVHSKINVRIYILYLRKSFLSTKMP